MCLYQSISCYWVLADETLEPITIEIMHLFNSFVIVWQVNIPSKKTKKWL